MRGLLDKGYLQVGQTFYARGQEVSFKPSELQLSRSPAFFGYGHRHVRAFYDS